MKPFFYTLLVLFMLSSCGSTNPENRITKEFHFNVPSTFDSLPDIPKDNMLTPSRIELGKVLFFDTRLSGNGTVSCGTCHQKDFAYADHEPFTQSAHEDENPRNAPTLINVAYQKSLFAGGGIHNLETQFLSPFVNETEMNFSINDAVRILTSDTVYKRMAVEAYGKDLDAYTVARAISSFERSLVSKGSDYDAYADGEKSALSPEAVHGMNLFFSQKTNCSSCHNGFLFTDQDFHNIGLYENDKDEGRAQITLDTNDIGKFKTPTMRNITLTAPYMHDGSLTTLEQVLEHYNGGGKKNANKDERIDSLKLTPKEMSEIIAFLKSLTDRRMPG